MCLKKKKKTVHNLINQYFTWKNLLTRYDWCEIINKNYRLQMCILQL